MKLRTKITLTVAVLSILSAYTFLNLFNRFVAADFDRIEKIEAVNEMKAVKSYADDLQMSLDRINMYLSSRDDTYQFARDQNKDYITKNLNKRSFDELGVDYIILLNPEGKIIYSKGFDDLILSKTGVPEYLLNYLQNQNADVLKRSRSGFEFINGNALLLSSSIIGQGIQRSMGYTMVLGKRLTDLDIKHISEKSGFKVEVLQPESIAASTSSFKYNNEEIFFSDDRNEKLHIYSSMGSFDNAPSMALGIEMNRDIQILSNRGKLLLFATISVVMILCAILLIFILNRFVFRMLNQQLALLNTVPAMVFYKDNELRYIMANKLFYKFFKTDKKKSIGKTFNEIVDGSFDAEAVNKIDSEVRSSMKSMSNVEVQCKSEIGSTWLSISESPVIDIKGDFDGIVGIMSDITEMKKRDEKLKFLSYYDSVTMLPNREYFMECLSDLLRKGNEIFSVLYILPNDFDMINEIVGPSSSDEFLKVIAQRISMCLRSGDILSRLRGDEFAVIYKESDEAKIEKCCNNIFQNIKKAWQCEGKKYYLSANIGIAVCPYDGDTPNSILKNSNTAMHMSKVKGKNYYTFYTKDIGDQIIEKVELENDLRHAVMRSEFELYYQPQVNIGTRDIFGYEALIRWNHPKKGLVSPGVFIPLAEETGIIISIGKWVIWEACRQLKRWEDNGIKRKVSINISAKQLDDEKLVAYIRDSIIHNSISPSLLEVEITESVLLKDGEKTLKKLQEIKAMGVNILLDDFGTGYSSLLYLKNFPIDKIKIDQNFVRDINESDDEAIVNTIITLSKGLGIKTIAEGVETEDQYTALKKMGCDEIQGYLFGRPAKAGTF